MISIKLIFGIILIAKGLYSLFGSKAEDKIEEYRSKYGEKGTKYYYIVCVILPIITGVIFMLPGIIIPMMY